MKYRVEKFDGKGWAGGKVELDQIASKLNELGREGWDLISMIDTNDAYGATKWVVATFKRAIA